MKRIVSTLTSLSILLLIIVGGGGLTHCAGSEGLDKTDISDSGDSICYYLPAERWSETPYIIDDERYSYVVHYTTDVEGDSLRNYAMCFDSLSSGAVWVAYPYHAVYDGDVSRSSSWKSDPLIETDLQAYLSSSYPDRQYDRGHQIPSADRLATKDMNKQTFYYSNSTPQSATLNRQRWAMLEREVREQVCSDTLYVVTGAHYDNSIKSTVDKNGKSVAVPAAYYKVLLRTRSGDSGEAIEQCDESEMKSIAFWVENRAYSTLPEAISVERVEELSGFKFFPNVPQRVKQQSQIDDWDFNPSLFE